MSFTHLYNLTNNAVPIKYLPHNPIPFIHIYSPQTPVLSVTAGSVNPAAIYHAFAIFTLHKPRCVHKISPPKPHPSWRRYTFLSHLTTKSKISVRWIKKLVAATCGVCVSIHKLLPSHLYNYSTYTIVYAFVRIQPPPPSTPSLKKFSNKILKTPFSGYISM